MDGLFRQDQLPFPRVQIACGIEQGLLVASLGPVLAAVSFAILLSGASRDLRRMNMRIATLNLKWKAFRGFFDFAPTDAELARGAFQLGEEHGAQVFSKMLSGDQGVPLDLLQVMAERINRQALAHRAHRSVPGPLGELAITAADLAEASLFAFLRRLVALSPVSDQDRLDRLHRDLMEALTIPFAAEGDQLRCIVERYSGSRSFAPFKGSSGPPVFEPGRDLGQFLIEGPALAASAQKSLLYVFLRRDTAPLGRRAWEEKFSETVEWLPSPFPLTVSDGAARLFAEPVPVLPEPGHYRLSAVLVRDLRDLRALDPRLDRRKPVTEAPPPVRFDEAASVRFLTNVGRALERRDGTIAVAAADYIVAPPTALPV